MVLLLYFLYGIRSYLWDHQQIVLYSFWMPMRCSSSTRLEILLQIFRMKIWARWPYIHLLVVFLQNASRTALCYATNTAKWKHSQYLTKSSTKHKESGPDWNDKNGIMQTTRSSYHGRFYQWLRLLLFKEIFDQEKTDCELFYSWTKTSQRLTLYLLSSHRHDQC